MMNTRIGDLLIDMGYIDDEVLQKALKIQKKVASPLGRILLSHQWIEEHDIGHALAMQLELDFLELVKHPPNEKLFTEKDVKDCIEFRFIRIDKDHIGLAEPTPDSLAWVKEKFKNCKVSIVPENQLLFYIHLYSKNYLSGQSVAALNLSYPDYSAARVFTGKQMLVFYFLMTSVLFFLAWAPIQTITAINILITLFLFSTFVFKFILAWVGSSTKSDKTIRPEEIAIVEDMDLPMYTILVPLYKEPEVIPSLIKGLKALSYPSEKLDIKLILEADDDLTLPALNKQNLLPHFDIITVPHSLPKTKPKACNYALFFAKGEYVTIYDAEDRPDPMQLKLALACFRRNDPSTAVVQARLNYFNSNENWITRLFTLEYSLWFDMYLPALDHLQVPIPLGGTSNHIKTSVLKGIGAWDPFNVTEDADLGIRLYQLGYNVRVLNSTTMEEANVELGNWIRQRSRWLKGYLQTYLVHSRTPITLFKKIGLRGFLSFQLFIGGTFVMAFLTPFLYFIYFSWLLTKTTAYNPFFPDFVGYLSLINLLAGNLFFVFIQSIGVFKRRMFELVPWALLSPVYWMMLSYASFKALYQLFTNPFYWEKTQHGISKEA